MNKRRKHGIPITATYSKIDQILMEVTKSVFSQMDWKPHYYGWVTICNEVNIVVPAAVNQSVHHYINTLSDGNSI